MWPDTRVATHGSSQGLSEPLTCNGRTAAEKMQLFDFGLHMAHSGIRMKCHQVIFAASACRLVIARLNYNCTKLTDPSN